MNVFMFYLLAGIILIFSVLSVTSRRILRAATYLLFVLIATAGLYFMLNYFFLAGVQLILYAGGIVVLIIFSILLTSHIDHRFEPIEWRKSIFSALAILFGLALSLVTILQYDFQPRAEVPAETSVAVIGAMLLNTGPYGYVLPFEVISILLLAAMIGAIVIAKKSKS